MKKHEKEKYLLVAGLDEAGRGCIAGPVVCAAVILPYNYYNNEIKDSKKLSKKKRLILYEEIKRNAIAYSIKAIDNDFIDKYNILQSTFTGWDKCIKKLSPGSEFLLIDGNRFLKNYNIPYETIIKGDSKYLNIAAASILAKVHKDKIMEELHEKYPQYNWIKNSGYGTKQHIESIKKFGLSTYHRKSYKLKL